MKAEIIPVGTEILLGNIIDTNSSYLANQLPLLGVDLYFISTVGDNQQRLVDTLKRAWKRADIVITTGGLGPTQDDITRESIGQLLGEKLQIDEKVWQELQDLFTRHIGEIPKSNMKQASIIPSAQIIANPVGTAPGWWIEKDNHIVMALPGPPDEMKLMWQEGILTKLRLRLTKEVIMSRTIKTFKLAEARVDELLAPISKLSNPTIATYINPDGVHVRITAKAKGNSQAEHLLSIKEEEVRDILSPFIWGTDDDTLDSVIGKLLRANYLTLATMESCTEGLLSNTIASGLESSAYFKGGMVACCNESKVSLGLDASILERYGNESNQAAKAMARIARSNLKADIGLAITGDMNPGGNSGNIFIGLSSDKLERTTAHTLFGNRLRVKQRAVYAALFKLRGILLEED